MVGIEFQDFPIYINIGIFVFAAIVVWLAGTKVSKLADTISARTNIGKALTGFLLLAMATDAPEIGTTISAASFGNAALATNNLFGGVVFQTLVLVIVDIAIIKGALTYYIAKPVILMQGVILSLLLSIVLMAIFIDQYLVILGVSNLECHSHRSSYCFSLSHQLV